MKFNLLEEFNNIIINESFADARRKFVDQSGDADKVVKTLDLFRQLNQQSKLKPEEKDLGKWIKAGWEAFSNMVKEANGRQSGKEAKKAKKSDSIRVHENDEWLVVIPLSKDASCFYGKGTQWCTAATESDNYFDSYFGDNDVTLFYCINKKSGTKLAVAKHKDGEVECFNENDDEVDMYTVTHYTNFSEEQFDSWMKQHIGGVDKVRSEFKTNKISNAIKNNDSEAALDIVRRGYEGDLRQQLIVIIGKDATMANRYARYDLHTRFPEGEEAISKHGETALMYATYIIQGRWPEGEAAIAKDASAATYYAMEIIKGRWPEGEAAIAKRPSLAFTYARNIIKGRWPEGEAAIGSDASTAYSYVRNTEPTRFPAGEAAMAQDASVACKYATVIGQRFPAAEPIIKREPFFARQYAALGPEFAKAME